MTFFRRNVRRRSDVFLSELPSFIVDDNERCLVGVVAVEISSNFSYAAIPKTIESNKVAMVGGLTRVQEEQLQFQRRDWSP